MGETAKRQGTESAQALLLCLLLLTVIGGLLAVMLHEVRGVLDATDVEQAQLQARYAAESALEFALVELNRREWKPDESEWTLDSRQRQVHGYETTDFHFLVRAERLPTPRTSGVGALAPTPIWQLTATGVCRRIEYKLRVQASDPLDLTRCLWNVTSFDFSAQRFNDATANFGNDGAAVPGAIEQVATIPDSGELPLASIADRYFGGVRPGTVSVQTANGVILSPGSQGSGYSVNYAAGTIAFPKSMAGQSVVIFHDYYHRVPLPPGPFQLALPYVKVQPGSEVVRDVQGFIFSEELVRPRMQNHFSLIPDLGLLFTTEHEASRPLQVDYAFYGNRTTGPIHVNGNVGWHERNLLYLLEQRSDAIEVTGSFDSEPTSKTFVITEGKAVNVAQEGSPSYREHADYHLPVPVDWHFYRRRADPERGGNGRYVPNADERPDLNEAIAEWKHESSRHWRGVRYEPPGERVDLTDEPSVNGLIFADGNLRLRGRLRPGSKMTIVSAGSIYLEDEMDLAADTSLALIARGHVCVNTTQWNDDFALHNVHALIYAVRGTFGVVPKPYATPAGARHNQLRFVGAITENWHHDTGEWARAFGALEWRFDPRYRNPEFRPPLLAGFLLKDWDWKADESLRR